MAAAPRPLSSDSSLRRTWDSGLIQCSARPATDRPLLLEALAGPVRHTIRVIQAQLFAAPPAWPPGFTYAAEFLSVAQEERLLGIIRTLPFEEAHYKEWRARRHIVSFGGRYDFTHQELREAPPIPQFLEPLRAQLATWAEIPEERIQHAMIAEYRPATPLGWHRDVPEFEDVLGVSLLGHARLRFRPWPPAAGQRATWKIDLEPRSAYLMRGAARWQWQHAVSPTRELRYSITFRTRNAQKHRR
jgi:alkylated DNA repair dioxygenase AlkB